MVLGLTASQAQAQAIPAQDLKTIQRQQDEIQRKNETQRRLIEQKDKAGAKRTPPQVPQPEILLLPEGQTCFQVGTIELKGTTLLTEMEQAELTAPYLGKCITLGDINNLLRVITNLYTEKGFVTSRGFVPPQDINDGHFEIEVIEGFIEGYELHDDKGRQETRLATAFPFMKRKPLNLRDIEQGLDQINRLKSNNAKLKLEPGSKQGATVVRIDNTTTPPWHLTLGMDNSGKESTGTRLWNGTAAMDDLFGLNDYLSVSWSKNYRKKGISKSKSVSGFWSVPLGYLTLSGSSSFYQYASEVEAATATYVSDGYSRTHKGELDAVFHRGKDSKSNATAFLRQHTTASFVEGEKLGASSYRLTSIGLSVKHNRRLLGGVVSGGLTYEKGIRALTAKEDDGISDPSTPRAQFHKTEFDFSYYRPFEVFDQKLTYTGTAHGQWSPMTLYSTDQISIGGESSVRGFHENTLGGDTGAYLQNTVSWNLPKIGSEPLNKFFGTFAPFVGYDIGALENDIKDETEKGVLSGYAFGLKTSGGLLSLSITDARHLRSPAHLKTRNREIHLAASLSF